MRVSFFATALLAFAVACVDAQPPRPLVVLVHGRGHVGDDTASLRRDWKRHLDTALTRAGAIALRDEDVKLAWYADVMDPSAEVSCTNGTTVRRDSLGLETFARDFLGSLASALPSDEAQGARTLLGDMLYALDGSRRCAAEQRVRALLAQAKQQRRSVVVLAYSLGALVTYAALDDARSPRDEPLALVTVGSPLGDGDIRALLGVSPDSIRMPPGVTRWENVYDPGDVFASPLADIVRGATDVRLSTRAADAIEAHQVDRYLRDKATGEALLRALCTVGEFDARACSAHKPS